MSDQLKHAIKLRQEGKLEESRAVLLRLIEEEKGQDGSVYFHCAWTHDALGYEKEAISFYEKAIQLGLDEEEMQLHCLAWGVPAVVSGNMRKQLRS